MYRLADIIQGEDFPEYECTCEPEDLENGYECDCWMYGPEGIHLSREDQLSVALSLDCFHDPIDEKIVNLWTSKTKSRRGNFEIRDVSKSNQGVIAQGRATKTGAGWNEDECPCSDILIKPDGRIKLCGCTRSPIIGHVDTGILPKWQDVIENNERYMDIRCYKALKGRKSV